MNEFSKKLWENNEKEINGTFFFEKKMW